MLSPATSGVFVEPLLWPLHWYLSHIRRANGLQWFVLRESVDSVTSLFCCYHLKKTVGLGGKIREKRTGEDCFAGIWLALGPQSFLWGQRRKWFDRHHRDVDRLGFDFWNRSMDFPLLQCCFQSLEGVWGEVTSGWGKALFRSQTSMIVVLH